MELNLGEVRRRAAAVIEREGLSEVDLCIGPHGRRKRTADHGPQCVTCAIMEALRSFGIAPSLASDDALRGIAAQLQVELGPDFFPGLGLSLYYWNDYSTAEDICVALRAQVSSVAA